MFRTLLLASLACSMSFACTLESAQPEGEGAVASEEGALLSSGSILKNYRQRFDFVLTDDDPRTCASFAKVTKSGSWNGFSTFGSADPAIRDKRCAAVFTPSISGARVTVEDLALNCREFLTARERWCASYGTLCGATTPVELRPAASTFMAATAIESACPTTPKGGGVIGTVPEMYARTYTGGCTSCGTISGGLLYLNTPNPYGFVTYNQGGQPWIIQLGSLTGPVTYNLGSGAAGPVMVSY